VIDVGTCRWRWATPRDVIFGNGRQRAGGKVFLPPSGFLGDQSFGHSEPICRDAQGGVVVKAAPATTFVGIKYEVPLQVLIVASNALAVGRRPAITSCLL